jgi:NAD-dependent dihydropyrimidine dehydrogenase PreA subunit
MFGYFIANVVETLLRMLPFPSRTGLIKIGNPNNNSPVFITGNFHLTVARVKRSLKGTDCYLLVANSHGINVWCSSTGGHFTDHSVVSVLKTSGIEKLVKHRRLILPQLAAAGIEGAQVFKKSGWEVIWGPVYAKDIKAFMANNFQKTPAMRQTKFSLSQRFEMAVAWAFPISLISALIILPFWREALLPLFFLIWGLSFLIFILFPFYARWLRFSGKRAGFIFFDFGRGGIQLILWSVFMAGLIAFGLLTGTFDWGSILRWGLVSFVIIIIVSIDLLGSTPLFKSSLHEERGFAITLDKEKCEGTGFCQQVCPRNCFEVDKEAHTASMPRKDKCMKCGACIIQCPFNALYFKNPQGEIIPPDTIRKYKVNLLGKRS